MLFRQSDFSIASLIGCHIKGRYNAPEIAQICAVIPGADIDDPKKYNRDILLFCQDNPEITRLNKLQKNNSKFRRINELHPQYDTAQYPIMLARGSYMWKPCAYPLEHHVAALYSDDSAVDSDADAADSDAVQSADSLSCDEEEDWAEVSESEEKSDDTSRVDVELPDQETDSDCDVSASESSDSDSEAAESTPESIRRIRMIKRCNVCGFNLLFPKLTWFELKNILTTFKTSKLTLRDKRETKIETIRPCTVIKRKSK